MPGQPGLWQQLRTDNRDINIASNRLGRIGRVWYIFPQGNGPRGSYTTFAEVKPNLGNRDVIVLGGVLREQAVAPNVYDVTVIGAANEPRQATSSGVPTGGGASWLAPTSPVASTPLLRVTCQGWSFENIQFAPPAGAAAITFDRRETTAIPDSSHGQVRNCYFSTGGAAGFGIELIEVKKIIIEGCRFEALTGSGGTAIKGTAGLGIASKSHLLIRDNIFVQNSNDIDIASTDFSLITRNTFFSTNPIEGGIRIKLNGSTGRNRVLLNQFSDIAADVTIAKGYTPATADVWNNYVALTAALIVTVPT